MQRVRKDVNYVQNLVDYVKKNLSKGYDLDSLKWALIGQGHSRLEVEKAIKFAQSDIAKAAPAVKPFQQVQQPVNIQVEPEAKPSFWKRLFG